MNIYIYARDIRVNDAIGEFCLAIAESLIDTLIQPILLAENYDEGLSVKNIDELFVSDIHDNDIIFFNHSIYDPHMERMLSINCKKILYFHNITPPELLENKQTQRDCEAGIKQIALYSNFDYVLCNSELTKKTIQSHVNLTTKILTIPPYIISSKIMNKSSAPLLDASYLIYCGRLSPHKRVDALIDWFLEYSKSKNISNLKLVLISNDVNVFKYSKEDSIITYHSVSNESLMNLLAHSMGFVTFSLHEGFCVPAFLSSINNVPIYVSEVELFSEINFYPVHDIKLFNIANLLSRRKSSYIRYYSVMDFLREVILE